MKRGRAIDVSFDPEFQWRLIRSLQQLLRPRNQLFASPNRTYGSAGCEGSRAKRGFSG
jgi:hypothetical protein